MKKDLLTHFVFAIAFFLLATFLRHWMSFTYYPFWLGALVGTLLPDVDYLIYVYALKPQEAVSQQAAGLIKKKSVAGTWDLLTGSRTIDSELIFHTAYFQIIFIAFAFLIMTSSGSLFGMGVVLAFLLHLLIDQAVDLFEGGEINHWFAKLNVTLSLKNQKLYILTQAIILVALGFGF